MAQASLNPLRRKELMKSLSSTLISSDSPGAQCPTPTALLKKIRKRSMAQASLNPLRRKELMKSLSSTLISSDSPGVQCPTPTALLKGFVSPVKNQYSCGSCVAFASTAAIETCFKKKVGVFGDYSEQLLVDCAYKQHGAYGCAGAAT